MTRCCEYIRSDAFRYVSKSDLWSIVKCYFRLHSFRYSFWLRLRRSNILALRLLAKVMHRSMSVKCGVYIPAETCIGYGLYIGHPVSIIVNKSAVLGDNCNISQGVTIGANEGTAATIGCGVYLGPNVCVVEDVHIGDFSTVGAGAVVVKDVPAGATVVGSPARVVRLGGVGKFILNRWPPPTEK